MRFTRDSRLGYWLVGTALIWLLLPADLLDMVLAPTWAAPNPNCDSFAIPMVTTGAALLPWAFIAATLSAIPVYLAARQRHPGADIFQVRIGHPTMNLVISLLAAPPLALILYEFLHYAWQALTPQTISSSCGGEAERVTLMMRGPIVQTRPYLLLALAVWILHIRALLLSPRQR